MPVGGCHPYLVLLSLYIFILLTVVYPAMYHVSLATSPISVEEAVSMTTANEIVIPIEKYLQVY